MENIFEDIKHMTADDIAKIIGDNYDELLKNIDDIPKFVKDVIYINELQIDYQMEGSLLYSSAFRCMKDTYSAMVRIGANEDADILKEILNLVGDDIDNVIKNGCGVLSDDICDRIDELCRNMYYDNSEKYDIFWQKVSDYIDREKIEF